MWHYRLYVLLVAVTWASSALVLAASRDRVRKLSSTLSQGHLRLSAPAESFSSEPHYPKGAAESSAASDFSDRRFKYRGPGKPFKCPHGTSFAHQHPNGSRYTKSPTVPRMKASKHAAHRALEEVEVETLQTSGGTLSKFRPAGSATPDIMNYVKHEPAATSHPSFTPFRQQKKVHPWAQGAKGGPEVSVAGILDKIDYKEIQPVLSRLAAE